MRRALILLAACSAPQPAPIAHHVVRPAPPTSPAPTVALVDGKIVTSGLPAVSADGSELVLAHEETDAARGSPDLVLAIRDRLDRTIATRPVQRFDQVDDAPAAIAARFAAANAWLAAQHVALHLIPMRALEVATIDSAAFEHRAAGDGIVIDWAPSQLAISRGGAAPFVQTTPSSWLVADRPMYAGATELCGNPAFLAGASVDTDRALAVVTIAYMGTDTCWEPPAQEHVVHW